MQDTTELQKLALQVREAFSALDQAKAAARTDDVRRRQSWGLRLAGWLLGTPAKRAVVQAETKALSLHSSAKQASYEWVIQHARRALDADASAKAKHTEQLARSEAAHSSSDQARQLQALADNAHYKLLSAADECDSAHTTETIDLFTTNKAISVLSSLETSSAADAIQSAQAALDALAKALPGQVGDERIDLPCDMFDFIVDLAVSPNIDVLSWINMGKLSDAAKQCRRSADGLQEVRSALKAHSLNVAGAARIEVATLRSIEAPFIMAAFSAVPEAIRGKAPIGLQAVA